MLVAFGLWLVELLAAFSVCVSVGFSGRTELLAATTVAWAALVVTPIYALGLTGTLSRWTLAAAGLACSAALLATSLRPGPAFRATVIARAREIAALPRDGLVLAARARSPVMLGLVATVAAFAYSGIAAYLSPSWRSWDALWYHEPIIGFTIQNHGFAPVDLPITGMQKINGYPRLFEMLSLSFAIFGGRRLIDLPNVLLMPGLFCAIYAACRRRSADVLACMGWATVITTIPAYLELLQTTFVDPTVPVWVACGFLFCTAPRLARRDAVFCAIALALAANTKISGVFVAAPLGCITAWRVGADASTAMRRRVGTIFIGGLVLLGFSSAAYIRNLILFHNPVWPDLKVDIPALGIHWPGMGEWESGAGHVNMAVPLKDLVDELTTRPYAVTARDHQYIYKYGLGVIWAVMPLIAVSVAVVLFRVLGRVWRARFRPSRIQLGDLTIELTGVALIFATVWTSTALWAARYCLHILAIGVILISWVFARPKWSSLQQAVIFFAAATGLIVTSWDYPLSRSVSQLARMAATPYPARELTPELGSPVKLDVGLARERELGANTVILTDDFVFLSVLWNNDYSNRVLTVRGDTHFGEAVKKLRPDWIYLSGRGESLRALLATGAWEELGPLYVEDWGTALHRKHR